MVVKAPVLFAVRRISVRCNTGLNLDTLTNIDVEVIWNRLLPDYMSVYSAITRLDILWEVKKPLEGVVF